MCAHNTEEDTLVATRATVCLLVRRYPDISGTELETILRYLRVDASGCDIEYVEQQVGLLPQYEKLCRDHSLWCLRPADKLIIYSTIFVALFVLWFLNQLAHAF